MNRVALIGLILVTTGIAALADEPASMPGVPPVIAPPDAFFEHFRDTDREIARGFYKKYIDVKGLSVAASGDVADEALQRTYYIVTHVLGGRPDILQAMVKAGTRLIVIGKNQVYTDMPEYRNNPNPAYQNERVRGTGGLNVTSFGEENLLNLPIDRYDDESIGVHEFCHTVDAALGTIDQTWRNRLRMTYQHATQKGLWKNAYTGSNQAEYWAEISQSYFDTNRMNNWNHAPVGTREQLKEYDPEGYELCRTTFNFTPETDWRYTPMRKQPSVIAPPERFKVAPYYTKFTWAREFTVVGNQASDESMLKANDIIRKMFAYRHDILKALINDGVKLVVLGPHERLSDLPEVKGLADSKSVDLPARYLDYTPEMKLLAVGEENVMGDPTQKRVGPCRVIRVMAKTVYMITATRPVDPDWDKRPRGIWQQYELRLKRLDSDFGKRLDDLYKAAMEKNHWKGTPAAQDAIGYWTEGVLAYFDAMGQELPPNDAPHPIATREMLKDYDPDLFALVNETFAYDGHVDWRFKP